MEKVDIQEKIKRLEDNNKKLIYRINKLENNINSQGNHISSSKSYWLMAMISIVGVFFGSFIYANQIPNVFVPNTPATADQMNANFDFVTERLWSKLGNTLYYLSGNVGINTDQPSTELDVNGTIKALSYLGDGSQLSGIKSGLSIASGTIERIKHEDMSSTQHSERTFDLGKSPKLVILLSSANGNDSKRFDSDGIFFIGASGYKKGLLTNSDGVQAVTEISSKMVTQGGTGIYTAKGVVDVDFITNGFKINFNSYTLREFSTSGAPLLADYWIDYEATAWIAFY